MTTLAAYLALCRVGNLPTVWSNVLTAMVLATGGVSPGPLAVLALALSCFYVAGMALNDLCDLEHDRQRRPERPLPSGRVSVRAARALTVTLFAAGFSLLALAPDARGLAGGLVLLLAIVAYDLKHKGNPLSVLIMAACRALVYVVVGLALIGELPPELWLAAAAQAVYVLSISVVARYENGRATPFRWPVIPAMLAGICLVDGLLLAVLVAPVWLAAGLAGALLTALAQRAGRGD